MQLLPTLLLSTNLPLPWHRLIPVLFLFCIRPWQELMTSNLGTKCLIGLVRSIGLLEMSNYFAKSQVTLYFGKGEIIFIDWPFMLLFKNKSLQIKGQYTMNYLKISFLISFHLKCIFSCYIIYFSMIQLLFIFCACIYLACGLLHSIKSLSLSSAYWHFIYHSKFFILRSYIVTPF